MASDTAEAVGLDADKVLPMAAKEPRPPVFQMRSPGPGDFILLRVIGRGAFGKVLQVASRTTGRLYAMKIYSKRFLSAQGQLEYTLAEKSIMARLTHPYIVALRYAFQTPDRLFLLSDYCPGGELFHTLRKQGLLMESSARVYLGELVLALEYMHAQGVVHRDLKPENLLLDGEGHIRIADYGLAKDFGPPSDAHEWGGADSESAQRTRSLVGTDEYLAPEMIYASSTGRDTLNAGIAAVLAKKAAVAAKISGVPVASPGGAGTVASSSQPASSQPSRTTSNASSRVDSPREDATPAVESDLPLPAPILDSSLPTMVTGEREAQTQAQVEVGADSALGAESAATPASTAPSTDIGEDIHSPPPPISVPSQADPKHPGYGNSVDWWALGALAYEMLTGEAPFRDKSRKELYRKICQDKVSFPKYMSAGAVSLIKGLMERLPEKRLCGKDMRTHAFFKGMNWNALGQRGIAAPITIEVSGATDYRHFDPEFTSMPLTLDLPGQGDKEKNKESVGGQGKGGKVKAQAKGADVALAAEVPLVTPTRHSALARVIHARERERPGSARHQHEAATPKEPEGTEGKVSAASPLRRPQAHPYASPTLAGLVLLPGMGGSFGEGGLGPPMLDLGGKATESTAGPLPGAVDLTGMPLDALHVPDFAWVCDEVAMELAVAVDAGTGTGMVGQGSDTLMGDSARLGGALPSCVPTPTSGAGVDMHISLSALAGMDYMPVPGKGKGGGIRPGMGAPGVGDATDGFARLVLQLSPAEVAAAAALAAGPAAGKAKKGKGGAGQMHGGGQAQTVHNNIKSEAVVAITKPGPTVKAAQSAQKKDVPAIEKSLLSLPTAQSSVTAQPTITALVDEIMPGFETPVGAPAAIGLPAQSVVPCTPMEVMAAPAAAPVAVYTPAQGSWAAIAHGKKEKEKASAISVAAAVELPITSAVATVVAAVPVNESVPAAPKRSLPPSGPWAALAAKQASDAAKGVAVAQVVAQIPSSAPASVSAPAFTGEAFPVLSGSTSGSTPAFRTFPATAATGWARVAAAAPSGTPTLSASFDGQAAQGIPTRRPLKLNAAASEWSPTGTSAAVTGWDSGPLIPLPVPVVVPAPEPTLDLELSWGDIACEVNVGGSAAPAQAVTAVVPPPPLVPARTGAPAWRTQARNVSAATDLPLTTVMGKGQTEGSGWSKAAGGWR